MTQASIQGKVLALMQNIFLHKRATERSFKSAFLIESKGINRRFSIEWWTIFKTEIVYLDLVQALRAASPRLAGGDAQTFRRLIIEVIHHGLADLRLFDLHRIVPPSVDTLFDAIAMKNKAVFAQRLFKAFVDACEGAIRDWLVIYPLHRVSSETMSLGFDGLSLVSSGDAFGWSSIANRYPDAVGYDLQNADWVMDLKSMPHGREKPTTWLVCEVQGTAQAARVAAGRNMRTFIAVLFSIGCDDHPGVFSKSGIQPFDYAMQFAGPRGDPPSNELAHIGVILPPLLMEWRLDVSLLDQVKAWHQKRSMAALQQSQRSVTAAQFLHYAIIADELERFIHLIITLDALFGEQGKVEGKILDGISRVFPGEPDWTRRIEVLFGLRSEIVHGECSSIGDWSGLENYSRRFRSAVFPDTLKLAVTSLRRYFDLPPEIQQKRLYQHLTKPLAKLLFRTAGVLNRT